MARETIRVIEYGAFQQCAGQAVNRGVLVAWCSEALWVVRTVGAYRHRGDGRLWQHGKLLPPYDMVTLLTSDFGGWVLVVAFITTTRGQIGEGTHGFLLHDAWVLFGQGVMNGRGGEHPKKKEK